MKRLPVSLTGPIHDYYRKKAASFSFPVSMSAVCSKVLTQFAEQNPLPQPQLTAEEFTTGKPTKRRASK